jgi:membrane protease YdiL (CAAX protease family)
MEVDMKTKKMFKKPLLKYFVLTYLLFCVLLAVTGVTMQLNAPKLIQYILPIICSWTPTFVFLLFFKKLLPDLRLKVFLKQQFCTKINISNLLLVFGIQTVIFLIHAALFANVNGTILFSTLTPSISFIAITFLDQLVRGPIGEELGWRGYALNELQKKHSPLLSAIIVGVVWGFWHTPLWFLTSGYTGLNLVLYIVFFMITIITTSVIIACFYNNNKNIIIAMMIHQLMNFYTALNSRNLLEAYQYVAPLYLLFALILVIAN